ncbi:hypothetical protein MMC30_004692 [Trapelia coarctata]|nr:hypothetical protein [Trapelia coarctata]
MDSCGLLEKIGNDTEGESVGTKELKGEAKALAIPKSFVGGIFGDEEIGAYPIVASGKYEDDEEDLEEKGETLFFTGGGGHASETKGKKKKGSLQRGAQPYAQKLSKGNAALLDSYATASPVRVIRGIKLDKRDRDRYRYDGIWLYRVEEVWEKRVKLEQGTYSFKLRKVPGQAPIPPSWWETRGNPERARSEESESQRMRRTPKQKKHSTKRLGVVRLEKRR